MSSCCRTPSITTHIRHMRVSARRRRRTACTSTGQWLITRYDDVANLFPDHVNLSSSGFQRNYFEQLDPAIRQRSRTLEARGNAANVLTTDPPDHTRLRRALQASFTARRIDAMHALIQRRSTRSSTPWYFGKKRRSISSSKSHCLFPPSSSAIYLAWILETVTACRNGQRIC